MSRTPVREALQQLAREGLVTISPRRGTFVARLSVSDVREIFEVREALEGFAAGLAARFISDEELERLEAVFAGVAAYEATDKYHQKMEEAGDELHRCVVELSNNGRIAKLQMDLHDQVASVARLAVEVPGLVETSYQQHRGILAAISARTHDLAERLMREHLDLAKRSVLEFMMNGRGSARA